MTKGGIIIRQQDRDRHQHSQMAGLLVAVGEDAWEHSATTVYAINEDGREIPVERRVTGYSTPFAKGGDRGCFARYNGQLFDGEDGLQYRLLNDEDITGLVSDTVNFTDLKSREPLGAQG